MDERDSMQAIQEPARQEAIGRVRARYFKRGVPLKIKPGSGGISEVARRAGLSVPTLSRLVNERKRWPEGSTLDALAGAIGANDRQEVLDWLDAQREAWEAGPVAGAALIPA